jgi:predicted O-methyltransferase YrrM
MEFIDPKANEYVEQFSNATPAYLKSMYEQTTQQHPHAHLQSNWNQGGFLTFLSKMKQPKCIVEIGTFTGFSALCLAEGLQIDGLLHTYEIREADALAARNHFDASPFKDQIITHIGDAKELLKTFNQPIDIAFIDADKTGYIEYYKIVKPLLQDNGIIIVDNVLFHGEVLPGATPGKSGKAIQAFNEYIYSEKDIEITLLTIRDGITLIRKKKQ